MKTMGFGDYARTATPDKELLRQRGFSSSDIQNRRRESPRTINYRQVNKEQMNKLTWKATFRELFIMLLIAACTAGVILSLGQYF